jgi:hypothetical protein
MHILFANTGVQVICIPLQSGRRYTTAQIGYGWQHCRCKSEQAEEDRDEDEEPEAEVYPYIQWQIIQSHVSKLFLAVDTSLGDPDIGYFCDPSSLAGDFHVTLTNCWTATASRCRGAAGRVVPAGCDRDGGRSQAGPYRRRFRQQPHRRPAGRNGGRGGSVGRDAAVRTDQPLQPGPLQRRRRADRQAQRPLVLVQDAVGQHAVSRTAGDGQERILPRDQEGIVRRQEAGQTRARDLHPPAAVRRLVDGADGTRGRRDLADHARQGRFPHRRQFAQAVSCGPTTTAGSKAPSGTWPIRTTAKATASSRPSCTGRC